MGVVSGSGEWEWSVGVVSGSDQWEWWMGVVGGRTYFVSHLVNNYQLFKQLCLFFHKVTLPCLGLEGKLLQKACSGPQTVQVQVSVEELS